MARDSLALDQLPALHRCVEDGTLELLYQPEIDLQTGGVVAMEGLLRWHHETLGVLQPPAFLELADASGEIVSIGEWVLRAGADQAARWAKLPAPPRRLWLNVSAAELVSGGSTRRSTAPSVVACSTRVDRMTATVTTSSTTRPGNGSPPASSGTDSAAASETAPRIPLQPMSRRSPALVRFSARPASLRTR